MAAVEGMLTVFLMMVSHDISFAPRFQAVGIVHGRNVLLYGDGLRPILTLNLAQDCANIHTQHAHAYGCSP